MDELERANILALNDLGVSHKAILDLIETYPHELIEKQLKYLPYRNARRPEAFIVDAIRFNYSAPKEFFYAKNKAALRKLREELDQDAQPHRGLATPEPQGYGVEGAPGAQPSDDGMESGGTDPDDSLPDLDIENW